MFRAARPALLAATVLGASVVLAAAQSGTGTSLPSTDNEASAMGNCFDRRLGVTRSGSDSYSGPGGAAGNTGSGASAPSGAAPDRAAGPGASGSASSGRSGASETGSSGPSDSGTAGRTATGGMASSSSLPDC